MKISNYNYSIEVKRVWCGEKIDILTNGMEQSEEIYCRKYSQLISHKEVKAIQWKKDSRFNRFL